MIQNDIGNRVSDVTIVGAITSTLKRNYPFQVHLPKGEGGVSTDSFVTLNQIRSVDRKRLARRLGAVSEATIKAVDQAIVISLGIDIDNIV